MATSRRPARRRITNGDQKRIKANRLAEQRNVIPGAREIFVLAQEKRLKGIPADEHNGLQAGVASSFKNVIDETGAWV